MLETTMVADWWGYADGDRTLVGIVVVAVVVAALGYVFRRFLEHRKRR